MRAKSSDLITAVMATGAGLPARLQLAYAEVVSGMPLSGLFSNRKLGLAPLALALNMVFSLAVVSAGAENQKHKITVHFNYNFDATPACSSSKSNRKCVQDFVLYDLSAGEAKRSLLMIIPVPPKPKGLVKGISATTPPLLFEPGKHFLAVVARMPDGTESTPATIWVNVP